MCNQYISWEQYNLIQQQIQWYNEWCAREQERLYFESLEDVLFEKEVEEDLKCTYCYNCEKNCVIKLDGYTKCMGCKDILTTDLKQIRKTYSTKSIQNKITHFTNALNEYLKDTKFYEVQQIVDVFSELIDFMRVTKKVGDKLPNISAKFFIEKYYIILGYLLFVVSPLQPVQKRK